MSQAEVSTSRSNPGRPAKAYYLLTSLLGLTFLLWITTSRYETLLATSLELLPWIALLAIAHLLPLRGRLSAHLAVDLPLATSAALILPPFSMAVVGAISSFDAREFRGQISPTKALFNRVQTALSYCAASAAAHAFSSSPEASAYVLPLAFLALAAQVLTNYCLVSFAISIEQRRAVHDVIRQLRLGTVGDFLLSFMAGGVLGAMLAALYDQVHPLTALAFLGPVLLARQVLSRSQMLMETSEAFRTQEQVVARISHQITEERSDERKIIAADLHDEVLQPLFRVSLMAHVVKAELATGRLLAMDQDLPELVRAAELASASLRELIGDLRRSTIGRGGLPAAIRNLVRALQEQTSTKVSAQVEDVCVDGDIDLVLYQVAKEALTNAVTHSEAKSIHLRMRAEGDQIRLSVRDDGRGFDPVIAKAGHFGLDIMRERTASAGGMLMLRTAPNQGCHVEVTFPTWHSTTNSEEN